MTAPTIPRAALVTGGAQRIGAAIVRDLAAHGWAAAVHYRHSRDAADALVAEIENAGGRAIALDADLADEAQVAALVPRATAALGPLGLLVNDASTFERDEALDATRASWDAHMEPNLRAPFVLTQAFAREAAARDGDGVVVNIIDQRVLNLTPHFLSYTLSKVALWSLTQTLALALAPRVRVAGVAPGPTLKNVRQTDEQFGAQVAALPLQRGPELSEICDAVRFIVDTPSLTGQLIALDGGEHMGWAQAATGFVTEE